MGAEAVLFIARRGLLKIVSRLFADKEFQASVELCCHFTNNPKHVDLSVPRLFLEHKVRHMCPVCVYKPISKW